MSSVHHSNPAIHIVHRVQCDHFLAHLPIENDRTGLKIKTGPFVAMFISASGSQVKNKIPETFSTSDLEKELDSHK